MLTLWDLFKPRKPKSTPAPVRQPVTTRVELQPLPAITTTNHTTSPSMADRYEIITRQMLDQYSVRVRKWRSSMSGCAWQVSYADGRISRLIESPRPKGPMSCAIFLHEIGHHAIGLGAYRPRCLEEYHAWAFSLAEMDRLGLNITDRVRQRMADSLRYAVAKALRRGLKRIPAELEPYLMAGQAPANNLTRSAP